MECQQGFERCSHPFYGFISFFLIFPHISYHLYAATRRIRCSGDVRPRVDCQAKTGASQQSCCAPWCVGKMYDPNLSKSVNDLIWIWSLKTPVSFESWFATKLIPWVALNRSNGNRRSYARPGITFSLGERFHFVCKTAQSSSQDSQ